MVPGSISGVRMLYSYLFFAGLLKSKQKIIYRFRDSIVVSISACHADDPGSIPGRGVFLSRYNFYITPHIAIGMYAN